MPLLLLLCLLLSTSSALAAANPYGKATIRRDTLGVPHILADNEKAASYALGYAQAEDHCEEIAKRLMAARGEAHQAYGAPIDADFRIQQFRNNELSARMYEKLNPLYKGLIGSYIAGVNAYIGEHRASLPKWIPASGFTGADVIANTRSGGLAGIGTISRAPDLRGVIAPPPAEPQGEGIAAEPFDADGSNAFALHGSRTKSGSPILLGNPHLSWSSLYWEAHVTVPGKINFYGSTLPGIPVLRAGFNEHLGWVNTNNAPDLVDVFYLAEDPKNPATHYLYAGKSRALVQNKVTIAGQTRTFEETHLGPVVARAGGKIYVVQSAGLDAVRYYEGFYRLAKTKNLPEFRKEMERNVIPFSHFTYADAAGNIYYAWNARLPKRLEDGTDYKKPVPAEEKYLWKKFHKFTEFPQMVNPAGGYIANSNDAPWYTNLKGALKQEAYPSYFERGELRLRQQSILELLNNDAKHDIASVMEMKYNTRSVLAERIKGDLVAALRKDGQTEAAEVLAGWDNKTAAESKGAVLFLAWAQPYLARSKKPYATPWDAANPATTPRGLGDPEGAVAMMRQASEAVRKKWGRLDVAYGEANRFRFQGVDLPGDGASGNYGVYKVQQFGVDTKDGRGAAGWVGEGKPLLGFGDAWVLAVEFTKPLKAYSVVSYGQTTNPGSKHCCDQIGVFAKHGVRPVWFTEAEIKANLEREYQP
ncbi:7-beta-(4-carbaxybutanamido)cephalosporanic acid acylase [Bryobacterales bacterium F-183]|nr:7-beta-(4-carbaxybutanamido)cephalosporanic acid acylase [Bryobacterales bacterium F-183]